jgi:hypothetical protein
MMRATYAGRHGGLFSLANIEELICESLKVFLHYLEGIIHRSNNFVINQKKNGETKINSNLGTHFFTLADFVNGGDELNLVIPFASFLASK